MAAVFGYFYVRIAYPGNIGREDEPIGREDNFLLSTNQRSRIGIDGKLRIILETRTVKGKKLLNESAKVKLIKINQRATFFSTNKVYS